MGRRSFLSGGIRGNSAADSAAKDALDGDILHELIPFSDVKSHINKFVLELWQLQWDLLPETKLHRFFFLHLKDCTAVLEQTEKKKKEKKKK